MQIPHWQLPPGVSHGTWEYTQRDSIADDYDDYFAFNSLFEFDQPLLLEEFQPAGLVADLGCGTARALVPLVEAGHRGLAIDLSDPMLTVVEEKAADGDLDITCLQANLVELTPDLVPDESVDNAMCMFSTLGMIRGHENRQRVMENAFRILKHQGKFVVHVHNFWFNLRDPGGPWWVMRNLIEAPLSKKLEVGDKYFPYRGVPDMYLHVFRARELRKLFTKTGFKIHRWIPLEVTRRHPLRHAWFCPALRANGWIVVGQKP
ncbi:class I SAM-dependent methyltransferase [Aeoliella sp. SH292]|uniref:class I SAM-dependent methyltransferase n=1 Tax=Aeoliella sp. SH292 TaxID=3454464 RepID=UPI003F95A687